MTGVGVAAVTIDTQPQSQTVCSGSSASFTAAASGTSAPTVQWQVSSNGGSSWSDILGATNTTLSVFADATDGGNQYHAVFTNSDGTATSDAATLTVNPLPSALLFSGIGTLVVCAGNSVELSVTLSGKPPWSVIWSDGVAQSDITTSPLLRSVTPLSTTTYSVKQVSDANGCSGTVNGSATIAVIPLPTATVSGDAVICAGQSATLSVALTGAAPWSITWSDGVKETAASSPWTRSVSPRSTTEYTVTAISSTAVENGVINVSCIGSAVSGATITVNTPPGLTCPTVPTLVTDPDACSAMVAAFSPAVAGTPFPAVFYSVGGQPITLPHAFPVGATPVTAVASNGCGPDASCSFTVTVVDHQKPTITCPANITQPNDKGRCSAAVNFTVTGADNCPGVAVSCTDSNGKAVKSGDTFLVGTTTVTCAAMDTAGNKSDPCSFTITVYDTEKPTITGPGAVTVNADPGHCYCSAGNVALGTLTTGDNCGVKSVTNDAPATFPLGMTTVTWTVMDTNGNTATCTQKVTVVDNQKPVITGCPSNQTLPETCLPGGLLGAIASFNDPTVTDNCGSVSVTCTAPLGPGGAAAAVTSGVTLFPAGSTTVTDSAMDTAGNTATCSFNVAVTYQWSGVLQPISADGSSVFKLGSTVPVKFQLAGASACITTATATLSYAKVSNSVGLLNEAVSTSAATTGNLFRYAGSQYIFNWGTKGLTAGTYQLQIDLGDGVTRTATLGLK